MADLLNTMGKQNIAGLQMSFKKPPEEDMHAPDPREQLVGEGDDSEASGLILTSPRLTRSTPSGEEMVTISHACSAN